MRIVREGVIESKDKSSHRRRSGVVEERVKHSEIPRWRVTRAGKASRSDSSVSKEDREWRCEWRVEVQTDDARWR